MGINGLSTIGIMLAFVGIAVAATVALRDWVFRQAARNLEACFSDAAQQLQYANLPSLALETLAVLRTPSRRSALTRSHWVSTQRSIAWGCAVLDTAAPDLQLSDPRLRRWFRGILADAKRHVPSKVFVSARQFAADSLNGRSARTTTHPDSWLDADFKLHSKPLQGEPAGNSSMTPPSDLTEQLAALRDGQPVLVPFKIDADSEPVRLEMSREDRAAWWAQRAKAAANATGHPCAVQSADFMLYAVPDDAEQPASDGYLIDEVPS